MAAGPSMATITTIISASRTNPTFSNDTITTLSDTTFPALRTGPPRDRAHIPRCGLAARRDGAGGECADQALTGADARTIAACRSLLVISPLIVDYPAEL